MNREQFKQRMQSLKSYREQNPGKGYWDWRNSLPDDLPYTDDLEYDMKAAYESGAQPELQDDGTYHLPSRDSRNGRILKKSIHPTYWKGLGIDAGLDYNPYFFGNDTYTWNDKDGALIPWQNIEQFEEGGSVSSSREKQEEDRQWIINWLKRRQKYNNPAVQKQAKTALQRAEWDARSPYTTKYSIYTVPVTYKNMRDDWGGYYHPNEGVVLNPNVDLQKYGEPLIHEFSHSVNTNNAEIRNTINTITDKQKIIDRGSDMNIYLTSPEEIHSRLMEFRKLNNLDPTKRVGMPQLQYIKKHGKDRDLLNLFIDDQVVLDLLNNVATTKSNIIRAEDGGEVPPDNSPVRVNPFTGKPLANGAITPVLNIEDAANFTPAGDVLSIRDAYVAAKNNDLLGLGLAGLGFLPFVPRIGRSKVSKVDRPPIPEVHPDYFQKQMEKAERAAAKRKQTVNDFYTQQDQAYESLIENEDAFRRAVNADASAGTNYTGVYGDYIKNYSRESSRHNDNLTSIRLTDDIPSEAKAQVDPRDLNWIRVNNRYADPDELDPVFQQMNPGLVRHELGHITDEKAGLNYTNKLGDRSKFESESKLKEMFPKTYKRVQDYLLRGSEIKSHMNEFRDYLSAIGQYSPTETAKSLRQKLDKYGSNFKNLKILFDSYKSKSQFARDYNTIPLIGTSALGINYYLNQEEQRRD